MSRIAGVIVAAALAGATIAINQGNLQSIQFVSGLLTVGAGLVAFVALSTLARQGHARILERSLGEVSQLSEELRRLAERDSLTGLLNHGSFNASLEAALATAKAEGSTLSLVVADLDNFKTMNDAFGHHFGDAVLCDVAGVFGSIGGGEAIAARLGGDEFAVILPGVTRAEAVDTIREVEDALSRLRTLDHETAALGSFGIGTYPDDGASVQALFTAADGRMYSEKHRRKAESLANVAGASRKLFVRAGRAMRPDHSMAQILQEIADATFQEFSLLACAITIPGQEPHPPLGVLTAAERLAGVLGAIADAPEVFHDSLDGALPGDAWIIDVPVPDESGAPGRLLLAGQPTTSFRPDASVVVALADLVQAVVASGRAHEDARRAGRERDIHNDLAEVLARGGLLQERMAAVTRLIAEFTGVTAVSIEGFRGVEGRPHPLAESLMFGATATFFRDWQLARSEPEAQALQARLAEDAPCVIVDIERDDRLSATQRALLIESGVQSVAVAAIRFDGEAIALLGAASFRSDFFTTDMVNVLTTIADHLAPAIKVALLRDQLEASFAQLEQASRESLARLADAAEARDPHTAGHLRRIGAYTYELARQVGLSHEEATAIRGASAVHDLGKLSLSDELLSKPGRLTEDDWTQMRQHPSQGERLIGDSPKFELERAVARWHHERWDGSGYPDGLKGAEIPLPARIVAVADAFDALTTQRPYKPAWTVDMACAEIARERGRLFCPVVVDAMQELWRSGRLLDLLAESDLDTGILHFHDGLTNVA
ncbi:MAG: diguanylate cyclase [Chloroflexi bacterium]|nr:diguanylate cyclase [Chloroflexota bacterium]